MHKNSSLIYKYVNSYYSELLKHRSLRGEGGLPVCEFFLGQFDNMQYMARGVNDACHNRVLMAPCTLLHWSSRWRSTRLTLDLAFAQWSVDPAICSHTNRSLSLSRWVPHTGELTYRRGGQTQERECDFTRLEISGKKKPRSKLSSASLVGTHTTDLRVWFNFVLQYGYEAYFFFVLFVWDRDLIKK